MLQRCHSDIHFYAGTIGLVNEAHADFPVTSHKTKQVNLHTVGDVRDSHPDNQRWPGSRRGGAFAPRFFCKSSPLRTNGCLALVWFSRGVMPPPRLAQKLGLSAVTTSRVNWGRVWWCYHQVFLVFIYMLTLPAEDRCKRGSV